MKKLDFIIQTLLILLAIVSLIAGMIITPWSLWFIPILQFIVGCYQIIRAITLLFYKESRTITLIIYWVLVFVFFGSYFFINFNRSETILKDEHYITEYSFEIILETFRFYIWFFSSWIIAIYFYIITTIKLFKKIK